MAESGAMEVDNCEAENATKNAEDVGDFLRIRTLTNWARQVMDQADTPLQELSELSDGVTLVALVEALCGRGVGKHMYRRRSASCVLPVDIIEYVLLFLAEDELELKIDSATILSEDRELISMDLLWPLLLHYRMPGNTRGPNSGPRYMFQWLQSRLPERKLNNLVNDWKDGINLGALVNSFNKDLCPDWRSWERTNSLGNVSRAVAEAARLGVSPYVTAADIVGPYLDEISMTVYLHQFMNIQQHASTTGQGKSR